ncbi:MAG: PIN domain-containing protein [Gemmatimonadota bacterium]
MVITAFFKNAFIKTVPVDFIVATRARRLIWDFPWLGARDAIHIATALEMKVPVLEHYDDDDIGKVAERIKNEGLTGFPTIRHPEWSGQIPLIAAPPKPGGGA